MQYIAELIKCTCAYDMNAAHVLHMNTLRTAHVLHMNTLRTAHVLHMNTLRDSVNPLRPTLRCSVCCSVCCSACCSANTLRPRAQSPRPLHRTQAQNAKDLEQTSRLLSSLTPYTPNNIVLHYTLKLEPQHKTTSHATAK